jgi:hypothetical protein
MNEPLVSAYVTHYLPGRLRLKIPEKKGNTVYFAHLADHLAKCPGITGMDINTLTGSLLLLHSAAIDLSDIASYAEQFALFSIQQLPSASRKSLADYAATGLDAFDRGLTTVSWGIVDIRSLLLLLLLALMVRQARQGQLVGAATSLLFSALDLAGFEKNPKK